MALKSGFNVKRVQSGVLELTAIEEALDIQEIKVANPNALTDSFEVMIKTTTMAVIPAYLLPYVPHSNNTLTLFRYVKQKYADFPTYKVLNGETFKVIPESTFDQLEVVYKIYDKGDIRADEPGTRLSAVRPFIVTFYNSQSITASGTYRIDAVLGDPKVPKYPLLERVPADKEVEIYGIAVHTTANGNTKATYLRMWKEETVLFDEDKKGLFIDPQVGNELLPYVEVSNNGTTYRMLAFHIFDEPFKLNPQDYITAEFDVEYDGTNAFNSKQIMVSLIGVERPSR